MTQSGDSEEAQAVPRLEDSDLIKELILNQADLEIWKAYRVGKEVCYLLFLIDSHI